VTLAVLEGSTSVVTMLKYLCYILHDTYYTLHKVFKMKEEKAQEKFVEALVWKRKR